MIHCITIKHNTAARHKFTILYFDDVNSYMRRAGIQLYTRRHYGMLNWRAPSQMTPCIVHVAARYENLQQLGGRIWRIDGVLK